MTNLTDAEIKKLEEDSLALSRSRWSLDEWVSHANAAPLAVERARLHEFIAGYAQHHGYCKSLSLGDRFCDCGYAFNLARLYGSPETVK